MIPHIEALHITAYVSNFHVLLTFVRKTDHWPHLCLLFQPKPGNRWKMNTIVALISPNITRLDYYHNNIFTMQ